MRKVLFTISSLRLFVIFTIMMGGFCSSVSGQGVNYRVQSLYMYKFSKFITWPENKSKDQFVIGVYGNSPIYEEMKIMASIKTAGNNQEIVVKQINTIDELEENYHMLYVASSKSREIRQIALLMNGKSVLIVAERDGLASKGAGINFMIMENDILKFEVNQYELESHGLIISPELLKLGFVVG
ncbi:YfiR family protein [Bacteroidota bacterium]